MIFLDNASSSYYKPPSVINAAAAALRYFPANPSRSSHWAAKTPSMLIYNTRKKTADFIGATLERVIFCGSCTEALNLAIYGTAKKGHVITSVFEHNSVLRPLFDLYKQNIIKLSILKNIDDLPSLIRPDTYMVALNHVSNVTGETANIAKAAEICRKNNLLLLVDGAQSGGHIPIGMESDIDMLALAPHKGFHAMAGLGVLAVSERVKLTPIKKGGTGNHSTFAMQPDDFPEGFEAGTPPTPAIAAFNAGLSYICANQKQNAAQLLELSSELIERLKKIKGVTIYSKANNCGIVAFNLASLSSQDAGDILNEQYGIAVRCGFHCAPLLHDFYKTGSGMIRVSFGCDNTYAHIDALNEALLEMSN